MARLRNLRPQVRNVKPAVVMAKRVDAPSWRSEPDAPKVDWKKTSRWQRLRWDVLVRDAFTCQWPGCGAVVADTSQLVADHIVAHRGNEALFWDAANLQCLCKACHDGPKQKIEAAEWRYGPGRG